MRGVGSAPTIMLPSKQPCKANTGKSHFELKRCRTINPSMAKDKDTSASAQEAITSGNG